MIVVGIDENGLGPLLGPLVVTAAAFRCPGYDRERFWSAVGDLLPAADSKELYSRAKLPEAERATLRWLAAFGQRPPGHAELVDKIVIDGPPLPCAGKLPGPCRPAGALPRWSEPDAEVVDNPLAGAEIEPLALRAVLICPGTYNAEIHRPSQLDLFSQTDELVAARAAQDRARNGAPNKFRLDFESMVRLARSLTEELDEEVHALCGKVGSTRRYEPWFAGAGITLHTTLGEEREESSYRVPGLGTLSFIRDADAAHLPVAVASMVGKYLRELAMDQINATLGEPGDRPASGYRDRVTAAFVEHTAAKRRELGLVDSCFLRRS